MNSSYTPGDHPATIAELASIAQQDIWDASRPLKHWLRTAEKARKVGQAEAEAQNYEAAFVEFAKAATIVLERLPKHSEYQLLLNADQRHNLGLNGQDILDHLSQLKPILVDRYERWRSGADSRASSSLSSDPRSREDSARRKREAQEQERAMHAKEAVQREEEWKRQDLAKRQAEELERRVREESSWARQPSEVRYREASEARRAADAREAAEHERIAQAARLKREEDVRRQQSDDERREEERSRRRADERRRQEQDGILRRQQEAEASARAARREIVAASGSVTTPQPSRPASSSQNTSFTDPYGRAPPTMPLESPSRYDDDTDVEGTYDRNMPWQRSRHADQTPTKAKHLNAGAMYPPSITTTSPAPPELGSIRYPTLMSQHQLKQGYVPSLQSMFSHPSSDPPSNSSLLFDAKPSTPLYSNILPKPSAPAGPPIPPYAPGMPMPDTNSYQYDSHYSSSEPRGHSPSGARPPLPPLPSKEPQPPPSSSTAPRIVRGASAEPDIHELKSVKLPRECLPRFLSIARVNTLQNRETCGLLLGKDKGSKFVVTTLLIPKQHSTSDTCTMDEEELVLQFTEERHLITLGWIHTHPTQSCFMSSVDLHTHSGFQRMLPESFAVVCAPHSTPTFGIFRLTDPDGLQTVLKCTAKEAFHPHPEVPIYT
ncbi:hypothetical protein PHLCEN_2v1755, partial [Hermanssonia centrifuga]